jgi:predicted solute-binding protein
MGEAGRRALEVLFERGAAAGLIEPVAAIELV